MIRRSIGMMIAFMLVVSISSFAFARGTPQKAFTSRAAIVQTSPVATVPAQVGYDVIQNITTELCVSNTINAVQIAFTTARRGLSPTVDWRLTNAFSTSAMARSSPTLTKR